MSIPILDQLTELGEHEETIIVIQGQAFLVTRATEDDIERIGRGYFCMD
ncbi:hypothetical protein COLU111180_04265 [Cohnella lubricantis]|uniref:Uncharacterized protein n=1 Tax=Cohnella lubricantis TaxID=2163172 RepID=A0A841T8S2_9BACL|nr:hypothetical protein [Cohnella lubricantis]MBB6676479.1 hypothetical protein [Cohnella lubricantis]MBP2117096.1 hypothetical protein [Cohnella lubricantis]